MADQAHSGVVAERAERLPVRFEGDGTGTGQLTWGQRDLWRLMEKRGGWLPIGAVLRLAPGTTVQDVADELRFVMCRYPGMRTRVRLDPDGPTQVVSGSGEMELEVFDAPDESDPIAAALDVWLRYWNRPYDLGEDWPVRMAVVRHRGVPSRRVWMMSHLVTDGVGGRVISDELAGRDRLDEPAVMPPLEQARWQSSPAGQRHCQVAMRHWEKILRKTPARRFGPPPESVSPRCWQAQLDSLEMYRAVRIISARTGVESTSVLLAIFAVALARVTGTDPVVTQVTVSNRFRPGLARTVSPIAQNGLCVISVSNTTVDEVVGAARRSAIAAYKNAYYDPHQRDALISRVCADRGELLDIDCVFNDRRLSLHEEHGATATQAQVPARPAESTVEWSQKGDEITFDGLTVNVEDVPDTLRIAALVDAHHVPLGDVEACLRAMEEVAVTAALDPHARSHWRST